MADSANVTALKITLPNASSAILTQIETDVNEMFLNETHLATIPTGAASLIRRLMKIAFNGLGTEGLASQGFSGVSESFLDDLPKNIKRELYGFRKVAW